MENTGKALFAGDNHPQWFIAVGDKSIGPMTGAEVYDRVVSGEISWAHYVWKEGQSEWKRICDIPTFQAAVPPPPSQKPQATPPAPPGKAKVQPKEWFLYSDDSQSGPFTVDEVKSMLSVGKTDTEAFAWKDGMADWEKIGTIAALSSGVKTPAVPGAGRGEKRAHKRGPVIAKILIAEGSQFYVGLGRDVSIGGMQVMSDYVPAKVGAKLKLNISPPDVANPTFQPFVAEGVVVRILDDRRGFSFRFDELAVAARTVIERIIASS